jgi:hypothetical protein
MDEQRNEFVAVAATPNSNLKPYQTPALRRLGDIQSVVQSSGNNGGDGGGSTS